MMEKVVDINKLCTQHVHMMVLNLSCSYGFVNTIRVSPDPSFLQSNFTISNVNKTSVIFSLSCFEVMAFTKL